MEVGIEFGYSSGVLVVSCCFEPPASATYGSGIGPDLISNEGICMPVYKALSLSSQPYRTNPSPKLKESYRVFVFGN